ncbi:hypothetical protein [Lysinibacillus sp. IITD104]|uniref:hypothetical protein n=1 Tax=Lysinibacillus sp. IITD104 TaxID=3116650 RepID=UPI002FD3F7D0
MTKFIEQRVDELENQVAKLELIIHELRGKKPIEPSTTTVEDDKPLTPNQQRAAIIEKAKKFVEEKLGREQAVPDSRGSIYGPWYLKDFDFVVNIEKRTIIALCKGTKGKVRERGIAKCNPNDVFNEHIGKAIALGRALGLDVSEFEQAIQPTVAVGQLIEVCRASDNKSTGHFLTVNGINSNGYPTHDDGMYTSHYKIINDTNAQYGGAN